MNQPSSFLPMSTLLPPGPAPPISSTPAATSAPPVTFGQVQHAIDTILANPNAALFARPVDPSAIGFENYLNVVRNPMDLGTVRAKVVSNGYSRPEEALKDVQLVWQNAFKFNEPSSPPYKYAQQLQKDFTDMIRKFVQANSAAARTPSPMVPNAGAYAQARPQPYAQPGYPQPQTAQPHQVAASPHTSVGYGQAYGNSYAQTPGAYPQGYPAQPQMPVGHPAAPGAPGAYPRTPSVVVRPPAPPPGYAAPPLASPAASFASASPVPAYTPPPSVPGALPTLPDGERCAVCGTSEAYDTQRCDGDCKRLFHVKCLHPPRVSQSAKWYCEQQCRKKYLWDNIDAIMNTLESQQDETGRLLSDIFVELPSKEFYPSYYVLIRKPICINQIRAKKYKNAQDFRVDVHQMFKNAQEFNMPGSQVFVDAITLLHLFDREFARLFPEEAPYKPSKKRATPPARPVPAPAPPSRGAPRVKAFMSSDPTTRDAGPAAAASPLEPSLDPSAGPMPPVVDIADGDEYLDDEDSDGGKKKKRPTPSGPRRSSGRERTQVANYAAAFEDEAEDMDDMLPNFSAAPEEKDTVEKILADRPKPGLAEADKTGDYENDYEYLIKWRGKSYLHVTWVWGKEFVTSKYRAARIKRWWEKKKKDALEQPDATEVEKDEPFNPDFCEVDRILAEKPDVGPDGQYRTLYLVKWEGLPYTEATWEDPQDFKDDQKVFEYKQHNVPVEPREIAVRPPWRKLDSSPQFKDGNTLRSYQLEGLNWLKFCWCESQGSILADEMGLGKTVQTISFLHNLFTVEGIGGPFLVVSPLSTIGHWTREFAEWTDMNVVLYQGNGPNRELIRKYDFYYLNDQGQPLHKRSFKFHVLLTTYEILLGSDWQELANIRWKVIAVDEAQRLKNQRSKLLGHLKTFKSDHRVLLTGTPLQNNTQELWSLLNFIEPIKFASVSEFAAEFGSLENHEQVSRLHAVLRPHLLRRMKEDVEKSIPPKEETLIEVELTSIQKGYYKAILEGNRDFLNKGCVGKNIPNLLNVVMQLRKVCNHPFLIQGVEDKLVAGLHSNDDYLKQFIQSSGKLVLLDKLLPKLKEGGHKVLIFSQMVRVLDLLETYLRMRGYLFERLDGGVRGNDRQSSIDRFCRPGSDRFVFLLCTRAGGVGINLTAADTVIIYDSDWNPQNDIQAQARCHRIGQSKEVKVYRLITTKTYERLMFERASKKLGLDQAVLHSMGSHADQFAPALEGEKASTARMTATLDKKEIDSLLRYGAFDLFQGEDEDSKYTEESIDQILQRSSKVVWNETTARAENGPSSTFSMASFRSSNADSRIDMDDPDFWEKILPEAKTADKLLTRAQKPGAFDTETKRAEFLADFERLVNEVVEGVEQGRMDRVAHVQNLLLKVLEVCHTSIELFSTEQQDQLYAWQSSVTRPFRRDRRSRREADHEEGDSYDYDPEERRFKKFRERRGAAANSESGGGGRRRYEEFGKPGDPLGDPKLRKRFYEVFMSLGPNRWEDVRRVAQLPEDVSENVMKEHAEELLKQCAIRADDPDRERFLVCLATLTQASGQIDVVRKDDYNKIIAKRLKTWARQLSIATRLEELVRQYRNVFDMVVPPVAGGGLAAWWGNEEDKSLLIGCYKHGVGNWEYLRVDPELSFVQHRDEIAVAEAEQQADGGGAAALNPDGTPAEGSKAPAQARGKTFSVWPLGRTLEARVKAVLDSMDKMRAATERERARHMRMSERVESRRGTRPQLERMKTWSKKEQHSFRIGLMTYGAGSWDLLRDEFMLYKEQAQMEDYCHQLMEQCAAIVKLAFSGLQGKGGELGPDADDDEDESERPAKKKKTEDGAAPAAGGDDKAYAMTEIANSLTPEQNAELQQLMGTGSNQITPAMAQKLLKRLKLFEDLRERILPNPGLEEALRRAQPGPSNLPYWWHCPIHDKLLLLYTDKFGIGGKSWIPFLEDQKCPFYKNRNDILEFKKLKQKFMMNFVLQKNLILHRLEYLRVIVLDPASLDEFMEKKRIRSFDTMPSMQLTRSKAQEVAAELKEAGLPADSLLEIAASPYAKLSFPGTVKAPPPMREVRRDSHGRPILPLHVKGAVVTDLGTIVYDRPAFHSKQYIWPVGFRSTRDFPSIISPGERVPYVSEIIDGGNLPLFRVIPTDCPQHAWTATTSSAVWVEALRAIKQRQNVSVSGPEMYGFADPTVKMLIQELPNANRCTGYIWKEFDAAGGGGDGFDFGEDDDRPPAKLPSKITIKHGGSASGAKRKREPDSKAEPKQEPDASYGADSSRRTNGDAAAAAAAAAAAPHLMPKLEPGSSSGSSSDSSSDSDSSSSDSD